LSQPRDAITADVLSGPEGDALADTGQGLVHDRPHSRAATSPRNRPKQPRHKSVMSSIELVQESWRAISRFIAEQRWGVSPPSQWSSLLTQQGRYFLYFLQRDINPATAASPDNPT
jgi:hypothetical protein